MSHQRPILSKAEYYTQKNSPKRTKPSPKKRPYTYAVAKQRLIGKFNSVVELGGELPSILCPGNNIVTKVVLHPSYLAKSYFPESLFSNYNLKNLGSKEVYISPEKRVGKGQEGEDKLPSSMFFVSGSKNDFFRLYEDINNDEFNEDCRDDLAKLEDIEMFSSEDKISRSNVVLEDTKINSHELCYEVVLHASKMDEGILESFYSYIKSLNGMIYRDKTRSIKSLTFCFIKINQSMIKSLAEFVFVRVVRPVPELDISNRMNSEQLEHYVEVNQNSFGDAPVSSKVAIFDGGLHSNDLRSNNIRYFNLTRTDHDLSDNYLHGSLVTSAVVYGDNLSVNKDVIPVDHFKIYSCDDNADICLVDVLDRITSVLKSNSYKFVNLSIGPKIPCPDDEPNLWTSTLDEIASKGNMLIVVAVGNEGIYLNTDLKEFARIQPPADMLNGLSIGAANSRTDKWNRATYSCVGPGRSPGFVKPDALFFGGDNEEKLQLTSLSCGKTHEVIGTSFAAPLVTRLAALIDLKTNGTLDVATIRALIIHSTGKNKLDRAHCGWGRISEDVDKLLYCENNKVTVVYQGDLKTASGVRASLPFPKNIGGYKGMVSIDATVCFYTDVDQQHTVSYTRAGLEIAFRPDFDRVVGKASEAKTRTLFSQKKIYGSEHQLRKDSHKWETCYKVHDRISSDGLNQPMFDIRYLTRDEGHSRLAKDMRNLSPLHFSLVVTVSLDKEISNYSLYDTILNEYNLLTPIELLVGANVEV